MNQIKIVCFFLLFGSFSFSLYAQCESCEAVEGYEADYCYNNELFPGKCAQFTLNDNFFYFQLKEGKAPQKLSFEGKIDRAALQKLVEDKQVKKALDVLFLVEAIDEWQNKRSELIEKQYAETKYNEEQLAEFKYEEQESGLGIYVLEEGKGPLPQKGKAITVHYRGYLTNGNIFDESYKRGQPFSFPLGAGRVIKGWDEGIAKLPIGSHALLRIPPELGYGGRAAGSIPPNSTLIFDVYVKGQ